MAQEALQLAFADGEYTFKLTLHGIKEIQEKCGAGLGAVWSRLYASRLNFIGEDVGMPTDAKWQIADLIEPIRQGLIGGGAGVVDGVDVKVTPMLANRLIENYVLARPLQEAWTLSYAIVAALIEGYDPPKKKEVTSDSEEPMTDGSTTPEP